MLGRSTPSFAAMVAKRRAKGKNEIDSQIWTHLFTMKVYKLRPRFLHYPQIFKTGTAECTQYTDTNLIFMKICGFGIIVKKSNGFALVKTIAPFSTDYNTSSIENNNFTCLLMFVSVVYLNSLPHNADLLLLYKKKKKKRDF